MSRTKAKVEGNSIIIHVDGKPISVTELPNIIPTIKGDGSTRTGEEHTFKAVMWDSIDRHQSVECVIYAKRRDIIYVTNVKNGQRAKFDSSELKNCDYKACDLPLGTLITLHFE